MFDKETLDAILGVLNYSLFELSGTAVTPATMITVTVIMLLTVIASKLSRRAIKQAFHLRGIADPGTVGVVSRLVHYTLLAVGFGIAIQTIGINLGAVFAAGAVFAVGLGFAMQSIAQNFVSGVILLVERSIKPGDVLRVEGAIVRVYKMGIRATIVEGRDGEDFIVPNSVLIQSTVCNYTLRERRHRIRVTVGVAYETDLRLVRETLEKVAEEQHQRWHLDGAAPQVFLSAFGDSSVNFEVAVWMSGPWASPQAKSELHEAVWWAFDEQNITIAFPQLDVHFDKAIGDSLSQFEPPRAVLATGSSRAS